MSIRIKGNYENERNIKHCDLFKAVIREAFEVQDVIIGHHLVYVQTETRKDPQTGHDFEYQCVQEIAGADTLIFDHEVAAKLWGTGFLDVLTMLAREPVETRDDLLTKLYYAREK